MAFESENIEQGQDTSASGAENGDAGTGDDLSGVLGGPDATFVSGEKKPVNAGFLIMAGFLLAAGAGTYVMYTRTTAAQAPPTPEAVAAQSTISSFIANDKANAARMQDLLANTEKAVEQFRAAPAKKQIPVEDLQTNPFSLEGDKDDARVDDGNDHPANDAAAKRREAEQRAATLKAAQGLNLQFVVTGKKKSCLINNQRYTEGQSVGDFVVETIESNRVIIRKDDARFELTMKKK